MLLFSLRRRSRRCSFFSFFPKSSPQRARRIGRRGHSTKGKGAKEKVSPTIAVAAGTGIGIFSSTTGLAGALIGIPVLSNFSTLTASSITGSVLTVTSISAFTGACIYAYYEKVDLRIGTCLGFSGIATAKIGMLVNTSVRPQLMRKTVGVCCLLMAPIVAFKDRRKGRKNSADVLAIRKRKTSENDLRSFLNNYYGYVAVGAIAGLCQGLLGIGGGLVQVVCLSSMSTLPQCEIVGTCLASTFIINASAASFYARAGRVNRQAVALIAVSGAISSVLAGAFAIDVDEANLRKWIAAALVVSSVGMIA